MCCSHLNRREFVGLTTAAIAGGLLGPSATKASAGITSEGWNSDKPYISTGKKLRIQPILMYQIPERKPATSWKSWGAVQTEQAASEEADRITRELTVLSAEAGFGIEVLPIAKVKTPQDASQVHKNDYDAVIVYPATGSGETLRACFSPKKDKDTLVFLRHRSGPIYYWYEALSVKYLRTDDSDSPPNDASNHGGVYIHDVVVDDRQELLWRLRAIYGIRNFIGARIVALGGAWGKYSPEAPQVARDKYKLEIIEVPYEEAAPRITGARADSKLVSKARDWADHYLALPDTRLVTTRTFVVNAFVLYSVFKDLMGEHDAPAFTIRNCMTTVLPIAETTPCLTLSVLNDEGMLAFCESDFVVIPAGILLHYISGKPVFLHNSTFPHDGMVTCAHCSAPRRMDGRRYEPAKIVTHFESEYGAAPKVTIPQGQEVTFIDPEYSSGRWVGFKGIVKSNPNYEICRTQQEVEIQGDWRRLIREVRDSHWMMTYGDYLKEIEYASRKLGIKWANISETPPA